MSIFFHCDSCGKKMEAPDKLAGKNGKCPACKADIRVPSPDDEELRLAPLDEDDVERTRRLRRETFQLAQDIQSQTEPQPASQSSASADKLDENELNSYIMEYLRHMADGELNQAGALVLTIKANRQTANALLDKIAFSDIPQPELQDIPNQVLAGYIRELRSRITPS